MAGRKRLPTKLKLLKGTSRVDRVNPNEPEPDVHIPRPPDHLSKLALVEWGRISTELEKMGLMSDDSMAALAAYCDAYAEWVEVCDLLNDIAKGPGGVLAKYITETTNGNKTQSILIGVKHTALKLMKDFMTEFGITPASRSKVFAKKKEESQKNRFAK